MCGKEQPPIKILTDSTKFSLHLKSDFAKLEFFAALSQKIPSFVCFVFKIENKQNLKLQNLFS